MRSFAAVALILILAGCTSPAADVAPADEGAVAEPGVSVVSRASSGATGNASAGSPPPPDAGSAQSPVVVLPPPIRVPFAPPVELPLADGIGGGEPNIAALPDGTLFVTSPTGLQTAPNAASGAAYLWRSQDAGASWDLIREPMGNPAGFGPFCSCDADVVTSPDGWVYYSDWWNGNYLVEASNDGGDTWSAMPVTTREGLLLTNVDRQWLVAGPDGLVGLFYSHFSNVNPPIPLPLTDVDSGVHAVFSTDNGATWGQPVIVVSSNAIQIAHPRILPDGTLIMPYGEVDATDDFWRDPSMVKLAVSTNGGATWDHVDVASAPEGFDNLWAVQADVDPVTGTIHVGWAARVDDDIMAMYVSTSRDAGQTWSVPLALRSEGLNFLPWVAAAPNDTVALGWYGGDATGDVLEAEGSWYAYVAESHDAGETFVVHRVSEDPVKEGNLCPKGASCPGDRELLDYVSLTYDANGLLHFAFARSADGVALTMVASEIAEVVA